MYEDMVYFFVVVLLLASRIFPQGLNHRKSAPHALPASRRNGFGDGLSYLLVILSTSYYCIVFSILAHNILCIQYSYFYCRMHSSII